MVIESHLIYKTFITKLNKKYALANRIRDPIIIGGYVVKSMQLQ